MANIAVNFNWGSEIQGLNTALFNQLNEAYNTTASSVNTKITKSVKRTDPPSDSPENKQFLTGDIWVNEVSDNAWIMTSRTTGTAVTWKIIT